MINRGCKIWLALLATAAILAGAPRAGTAAADPAANGKYAAIVIDDFGNDMKGTEEMMKLHIPLTIAVMPFLPTTKRDAEWAHRVGHEVIVHMPMEPIRGRKDWLGPGAITTDLPDAEIRRRMMAAIDDVPHAVGINNHMGSKATSDPRVMRIVLEVCRERGMFFLDSHTNYRSIVSKVAKEVGVPCIENQLFLDDVHTLMHVSRQMTRIRDHLGSHDWCVAIGHVGAGGKITAQALQNVSWGNGDLRGIRFYRISEVIKKAAGKPS